MKDVTTERAPPCQSYKRLVLLCSPIAVIASERVERQCMEEDKGEIIDNIDIILNQHNHTFLGYPFLKMGKGGFMKYELSLVPPGGGEQDYCVTINNAAHIPCVGEYIILRDSEEQGIRAYRVLYVTSGAVHIQNGEHREESVVVQAEFIPHHNQSESHARSIEMYKARGKVAKEYPVSGY